MRILVVTPWFPTSDSPVSGLFVGREVEALARVHDVTLIHLDWHRDAPLEADPRRNYAYSHVSLARSDPRSYLRARRLVADAAAHQDLIHTHALTGLLPWLIGRPGGRLPWVHSEHWSGITAPETLSRGERLALRMLGPRLRIADAVVAESSRLAAGIRRFRDRKVDIVPCVVDSVEPRDAPATPEIRLVAVGGLIPRKGPLLAVEALTVLIERGIPATLTWVGEGEMAAETLAKAAESGVEQYVRLTGRLDDAGVSKELEAASMFLLPTQGDNFCVVAAEALVHGRPVVSGAATGAVDYSDPRVSRFVTTQRGSAYADAIQDLARATASVTAEQVAATVAGRFTPETVARQLTAIYHHVTRPDLTPTDPE